MKIYHGSLEIIKCPEIRVSNRTLDYGTGFYTTTNREQAEDWVMRRKSQANEKVGFINVYEIDLNAIRNSNCLWFDSANEEWVDFVYKNRNDRSFLHDYDFVYGPVANDRVYAAFTLYESGLLNKAELIKELKTYTLIDQLLFHTECSLKALTFVEAIKIES